MSNAPKNNKARPAANTANKTTSTQEQPNMTDNTTAPTVTAASQYKNAAYAVTAGLIMEYVQNDSAAARIASLMSKPAANLTEGEKRLLTEADSAVKEVQARRDAFSAGTQELMSSAARMIKDGGTAALDQLEQAALTLFMAARLAQGRTPDELTQAATTGHRITLDLDAYTVVDGLPAALMSAPEVAAIIGASRAQVDKASPDASESDKGADTMSRARAEVFGLMRRTLTRVMVGEPVKVSGAAVMLTAKVKVSGYDASSAKYGKVYGMSKRVTVATDPKQARQEVREKMKANRERVKAERDAEAKTVSVTPRDWSKLTENAQ